MAGALLPVVHAAFGSSHSGDVAKKGSTATVLRRRGPLTRCAIARLSRRLARLPSMESSSPSHVRFAIPLASRKPIVFEPRQVLDGAVEEVDGL